MSTSKIAATQAARTAIADRDRRSGAARADQHHALAGKRDAAPAKRFDAAEAVEDVAAPAAVLALASALIAPTICACAPSSSASARGARLVRNREDEAAEIAHAHELRQHVVEVLRAARASAPGSRRGRAASISAVIISGERTCSIGWPTMREQARLAGDVVDLVAGSMAIAPTVRW